MRASFAARGVVCGGERNGAPPGERSGARPGERNGGRVGDGGAARAGERGAARAGERGAARAGERGAARAGERGAARAGERGAARAGECGAARAGEPRGLLRPRPVSVTLFTLLTSTPGAPPARPTLVYFALAAFWRSACLGPAVLSVVERLGLVCFVLCLL